MNIDATEAGDLKWGVGAMFRDHYGELLISAT